MAECQKLLMQAGKAYPRTCEVCGLFGKCREGFDPKWIPGGTKPELEEKTGPGEDAKTKALRHAVAHLRTWKAISGDPYRVIGDLIDECDAALGIIPAADSYHP